MTHRSVILIISGSGIILMEMISNLVEKQQPTHVNVFLMDLMNPVMFCRIKPETHCTIFTQVKKIDIVNRDRRIWVFL